MNSAAVLQPSLPVVLSGVLLRWVICSCKESCEDAKDEGLQQIEARKRIQAKKVGI